MSCIEDVPYASSREVQLDRIKGAINNLRNVHQMSAEQIVDEIYHLLEKQAEYHQEEYCANLALLDELDKRVEPEPEVHSEPAEDYKQWSLWWDQVKDFLPERTKNSQAAELLEIEKRRRNVCYDV